MQAKLLSPCWLCKLAIITVSNMSEALHKHSWIMEESKAGLDQPTPRPMIMNPSPPLARLGSRLGNNIWLLLGRVTTQGRSPRTWTHVCNCRHRPTTFVQDPWPRWCFQQPAQAPDIHQHSLKRKLRMGWGGGPGLWPETGWQPANLGAQFWPRPQRPHLERGEVGGWPRMEGLQRCYVQQLDHTGREAGGGGLVVWGWCGVCVWAPWDVISLLGTDP